MLTPPRHLIVPLLLSGVPDALYSNLYMRFGYYHNLHIAKFKDWVLYHIAIYRNILNCIAIDIGVLQYFQQVFGLDLLTLTVGLSVMVLVLARCNWDFYHYLD
jgi:hypothetical protein